MSDLTLNETISALSVEEVAAIRKECSAMSRDFTDYQVDFTTDLLSIAEIEEARENVAALGMQAPIDLSKVQKFLFDTSTGFLVTGIIQQPLFIAEVDDVRYLVSGRHRATGLLTLVEKFDLSPDAQVQCVVFRPATIAIAMSMVLTSNGSRAVTKGEGQGFKLARYGVLPDANDCIRAGRDGTLPQSEAFQNAAWFSYHSQEIGSRTITTIQSIAKSFYASLKKMHYSYEDIVSLMDDMLFSIEEASALTGETNVARKQGTIAENIVDILALEPKESPAKKQAKRNVKATLFTRNL